MKIVVITNSENKDSKTESGHELIFHKIENATPSELRKSAKTAEKKGCELLALIPEDISLDVLEDILKELPDQDSPTALVTAFHKEDLEPGKEENKTILMLQLLTGEKICGFRNDLRIYPVKLLNNIPPELFDDLFFHVNILIKAAKAGYKIVSSESKADILVRLKKETPSLSYFIPELLKPLIPWPNKRLCPRNFKKEKAKEFFLHPMKFLKFLIMENATPGGLATAAATGMFLGTLPLLGIHTIAIIYVSIKLRLNKMLSVNISHLCMPPFVPFACIELGHYILHGKWLTIDKLNSIFLEASFSGFGGIILEWIVGSIILAPTNAILFATITYIISASIKARIKNT